MSARRPPRWGGEAEPVTTGGFSYLRNVAVDQHVVARERLADLADSIIAKYPHLLGISEDEGTAWVIRGERNRRALAGSPPPDRLNGSFSSGTNAGIAVMKPLLENGER